MYVMKSLGDDNDAGFKGAPREEPFSLDSFDPSKPNEWTEVELKSLELEFFNDMRDLGLDNDLEPLDVDSSDLPNPKTRLRDLLLFEGDELSTSICSRPDRPLSRVCALLWARLLDDLFICSFFSISA